MDPQLLSIWRETNEKLMTLKKYVNILMHISTKTLKIFMTV